MEKLRQPNRNRPEQDTSVAVAETPVPDAAPYNPDAQVIHGASVQSMPLAGMTLAQARDAAAAILGVDPRAPALINGRPARPNQRIEPNDVIEFVHHAGEKGARDGSAHRNFR